MSESWRKEPQKVKTRGCGHAQPHRRRCEQCDPGRTIFTTCSAKCLREHVASEHAQAAGDLTARLAANATQLNQVRRSWEDYETHRTRLHKLLAAAQRGEGLCVLGAGNCDDLELSKLIRLFGEVHLVDLDAPGIEAARARLTEKEQARVVLHGGVDLSGVAERIDRWGDRYPDANELEAFVSETAAAVAARIGRTFDVVLSACLVSQLLLPLKETLLLNLGDWTRLFAAVERAHLATMAALAREGGTAILALDVTSSHKLPALAAFASPDNWEALAGGIAHKLAELQIPLTPDPAQLLAHLAQPPLAAQVERARLTDPWIWTVTPELHALVYGLVFQRA